MAVHCATFLGVPCDPVMAMTLAVPLPQGPCLPRSGWVPTPSSTAAPSSPATLDRSRGGQGLQKCPRDRQGLQRAPRRIWQQAPRWASLRGRAVQSQGSWGGEQGRGHRPIWALLLEAPFQGPRSLWGAQAAVLFCPAFTLCSPGWPCMQRATVAGDHRQADLLGHRESV